MPLLDHFHEPLSAERRWRSFYSGWAAALAGRLNRRELPNDHFAEMCVRVGGRVDLESEGPDSPVFASEDAAIAEQSRWIPPPVEMTMPALFPDEFEVQVYSANARTLVAAVELVGPANKDRPETRRAFAAKCASYLQAGIGVAVVDVVTSYLANMHDELIDLMWQADTFRFPGEGPLYASAYRPQRKKADEDQIALWFFPLAVGQALPTVPLALRGGPTVPVDLELTYTEVREGSRL